MELVPNEVTRPVFILWGLNSRHKLRHCYFAVKIVSEAHFLFQDFKSNIAELPESNRTVLSCRNLHYAPGKNYLDQVASQLHAL